MSPMAPKRPTTYGDHDRCKLCNKLRTAAVNGIRLDRYRIGGGRWYVHAAEAGNHQSRAQARTRFQTVLKWHKRLFSVSLWHSYFCTENGRKVSGSRIPVTIKRLLFEIIGNQSNQTRADPAANRLERCSKRSPERA
jgi:hypothetical protein